MDMQSQPILNVSNIDTTTMTTSDIYNSGTTTTANLSISGNLTFNLGSMIYVNGIMVNPADLQNASFVSPILDTGHEERLAKLEIVNKELREKLDRVMNEVEFLAKWQEV